MKDPLWVETIWKEMISEVSRDHGEVGVLTMRGGPGSILPAREREADDCVGSEARQNY